MQQPPESEYSPMINGVIGYYIMHYHCILCEFLGSLHRFTSFKNSALTYGLSQLVGQKGKFVLIQDKSGA